LRESVHQKRFITSKAASSPVACSCCFFALDKGIEKQQEL